MADVGVCARQTRSRDAFRVVLPAVRRHRRRIRQTERLRGGDKLEVK